MLLRRLTVTLVLALAGGAPATPLDTGHDLLRAVEFRDGSAFLDLLSAGLADQIEARFLQIRDLAETDPSMVDGLLERSGIRATAFEVQWMSAEDFVSRALESVSLPPEETLLSEEASLSGRNADVLFAWDDGSTLGLRMIWETSAWRVTGATVLAELFR